MASEPRVYIIIINLEGFHDTQRCLLSLRLLAYANKEIIVIDNGSKGDDVLRLRGLFPEAKILSTEVNGGFAAGNNIGMEIALREGADYIFLLNNDTEILPDTLKILVEQAEKDSSIGIIGPAIYDLADPQRLSITSGRVNLMNGVSSSEELEKMHKGKDVEGIDIQFVAGCALLIKRSVIEQIGMLDETFFLYYEDVDWCLRASNGGFRTVYLSRAKVLHKRSSSVKTGSAFQIYHLIRSKMIFLRKYSPSFTLSLILHLVGQMRPVVAYFVTGRFAHLKAVVQGTADGLRSELSSLRRE